MRLKRKTYALFSRPVRELSFLPFSLFLLPRSLLSLNPFYFTLDIKNFNTFSIGNLLH